MATPVWSIQRKLFLSHFLAVLLVSGSIGTYFYASAADSLLASIQNRLKLSAALVASSLDPALMEAIHGASDTATPEYEQVLGQLRRFRATNPDISFLYVMRNQAGKAVFVVDSDDGTEQAMPGEPYTEAPPEMLLGFMTPAVDRDVTHDAWGAFISGYAPLPEAQGRYLVGMDMRADQLAAKHRALRLSGWLSLAASIILAGIFSRLISVQFMGPIQALVGRCQAIAAGRLDEQVGVSSSDELGSLVTAFNTMSSSLEATRTRREAAEEALLKSRNELEERVERRTRELAESNVRLQVEVAERRRAEESLAQVARSDPLTGLYNRRAMGEQLDHELARFRRTGAPFSLVLVDLDHFKQVNDSFGHETGDAVLTATSSLLRQVLRAPDTIARWGGEEFLILLPETDVAGGVALAEKLRGVLATAPDGLLPAGCRLTLSAGVAMAVNGKSWEDILAEADAALYAAKAAGRDRVARAGDEA